MKWHVSYSWRNFFISNFKALDNNTFWKITFKPTSPIQVYWRKLVRLCNKVEKCYNYINSQPNMTLTQNMRREFTSGLSGQLIFFRGGRVRLCDVFSSAQTREKKLTTQKIVLKRKTKANSL